MRGDWIDTTRGAERQRLRGRLIALGVVPVAAAGAAAAALLLFASPSPSGGIWTVILAVFVLASAVALLVAHVLARRITRPLDAMLRFVEGGDEAAVRKALRDNPSWEIFQLFRRLQQLVQQNRAGHRALEEVEDVAREAARLAHVLAAARDESAEMLPRLIGPLAPVGAALEEFLRRRGRVRHEAEELARQLTETLRELKSAVVELSSRAEKGYLAATGAAFAQREVEKRLEQMLRPTQPTQEPWSAARTAADEAGRIENRLAVLALRHADDAPGDLLNDLRQAIERVRALETGTREALQKLESALGPSPNGYRVSEAGVQTLHEKIGELSLRIAEASAALDSTSRAAERARRLAAHAAREVDGFRRHLAPGTTAPPP